MSLVRNLAWRRMTNAVNSDEDHLVGGFTNWAASVFSVPDPVVSGVGCRYGARNHVNLTTFVSSITALITQGVNPSTATGTTPTPPSSSTSYNRTSHITIGAISGGAVGGVTFLALLAALALFLTKRRCSKRASGKGQSV